MHHEPVEVAFYDRKTNKEIASYTLGKEGIWYEAFRMSTVEMRPEDVYVLEKTVGGTEVKYSAEDKTFYRDEIDEPAEGEENSLEKAESDITAWADRINGKHIQVGTDDHLYEVNYSYHREEVEDSDAISPEKCPKC